MLFRSEVEISITWLPPELMARMHATEGIGVSYDYMELDGLSIRVVSGGSMSRAFAYVCRLGALTIDGEPRGLAAITEGRVEEPSSLDGPDSEEQRAGVRGFKDHLDRLCVLRRERDGGMEPMLLAMATGYDYRRYQKVKQVEKRPAK